MACFLGAPLIILLGFYVWSDPFKCIHPFDINDTDQTNREYFSTELFLRNYPQEHYNSFIFSSSRGCGMNTYRWKKYLPVNSRPFIFQAWGETVTGIELKLNFLDSMHVPVENALIMLDLPGSFNEVQLPTNALSVKHFAFTGKTRFSYNAVQFFNFIQKPSLWMSSVRKKLRNEITPCCSDTITNDWNKDCKLLCNSIPDQDSLNGCSEIAKRTFLSKIAHRNSDEIVVSQPLINKSFENQLYHIKSILERKGTDYYVVLTPAYCYTNPMVNLLDLEKLKAIFGDNRVWNFTGKNELTDDYNNFSDPNHFGQRVGWLMLEEIYRK